MFGSQSNRKTLFICSMGGILEFYDFIVYALMASYLARLFFPQVSAVSGLMAAFATFAVGYVVRPFGGVLFGHFGDRLGRKPCFTLSVLVMALSTFCIGLIPSYHSVGVIAPVLLTALRVCQGLSVGGEISGAFTYIAERIPQQRTAACAVVFAGIICGMVLGSLVNAVLTSLLSQQHMQSWGWRIPFFLGGAFGVVSYYLRKHLAETREFDAIRHDVERLPIVALLRLHWRNALAGCLIVGFAGSTTTLYFLFTPAYVKTILHQPLGDFLWIKVVATLVAAACCVLTGALVRPVRYRLALLILIALNLMCGYAAFYWLADAFHDYGWAMALFAIANGAIWGVVPGLLVDLFPTRLRYTGVSVSYNLGFGLIAGTAPLVATVLLHKHVGVLSPAYYLIVLGIVALFAVWLFAGRRLGE